LSDRESHLLTLNVNIQKVKHPPQPLRHFWAAKSAVMKREDFLVRQVLRKYGTGILTVVGTKSLYSDKPVDVAKILAYHEAEPTSTQTTFFREPSMREYAEDVAVAYQERVGRPLKVADVACSNGEETWSLAALLNHNGISAEIDGFDISKRELAVAQAGGPYLDVVSHFAPQDWRRPYSSYFQSDGEHQVQPIESIRSMASFYELDIATQQLEPGYDVVASYNMLWHYPQPT
jgi:hypothetical protein